MIRLLLAIALIPQGHFSVHGTHTIPTGMTSCGASARLLEDTYQIDLQGRTSMVNATRWQVTYQSSETLELTYQATEDAFTSMRILIRGDRGLLEISGITAARVPCADRVLLKVR